MVSAVFGLPGAGKSLLLSWIGHRAIQGRSINVHGFSCGFFDKYARVYTNFPLEGAYKLDFDLLGIADYNHCLILIDEIQLFADSRNFKNFSEYLSNFFTQHRKDHIDLIWCSQSFKNCDLRIRSVTDKLYYIDRSWFNLIRVRAINSYFRVNGDIQEGYEYCSGFNTKYFIPQTLYKYCDTWSKMKSYVSREAPSELWYQENDIKALGDIIHEGKAVTINSDNTITEG